MYSEKCIVKSECCIKFKISKNNGKRCAEGEEFSFCNKDSEPL